VREIRNNFNVQASRQDDRLKNPTKPLLMPLDPGAANGMDLSPKREHLHPRQTRGGVVPQFFWRFALQVVMLTRALRQ